MSLKNLFTMVKADRYTQDGRDQLIKAQEVETEDRRYKNGEISETTGLMKTPKGWVEPPKGKQPGAKKEEPKNVHGAEVDKIYERQLKRIKELKAKGFTDEQIDNDKIIKQTKEDMKNVGNQANSKSKSDGTETLQERSVRQQNTVSEVAKQKANVVEALRSAGLSDDQIVNHPTYIAASKKLDKVMENPDDVPLNKSWFKSDVINELPNGWKRVEGATTAPNGYVVVSNNQSRFGGDRETKLIKQEDYLNSVKQQESKNWNDFFSDMDKKVYGESKPASSGWIISSNGDRMQVSEVQNKIQSNQQKIDSLKKEMEGKSKADNFRTGAELKMLENENEYLRERVPTNGLKPGALEEMKAEVDSPEARKNYEDFMKTYKKRERGYLNGDCAPRQLTGDCKIRIRKQ